MPRTGAGMTPAEVRALPAVVDLVTAGRALGIGRSKSYEMVHAGSWPTRILRLGSSFRVPTADLRALLGIADSTPDGPSAA
jgi:hypothetical protein